MKTNFIKKIATCSLIGLGTVALTISLSACETDSTTTSGSVSLAVDGVTTTSVEKTVGSIFSIVATYSEATDSEGTWSWSVSPTTGVSLSGQTTNTLSVSASTAGTYVFTATYSEDGSTLGSGSITVSVIEAETTYSLRIDEDASTLSYSQGDTFSKSDLVVYRDAYQLGELVVSSVISEFDVTATVDGTTLTLTDGYELTIAGTYAVTVTYDDLTASTTISVAEDTIWQFTSTLGEYLSNNDYYMYSYAMEMGISDGVIVNYGSDTAYALSTGPLTYTGSSEYSYTGLRRFNITEYASDGYSVASAEISDALYGSTISGTVYYTSLDAFAYYNGFIFGSDWNDTYANDLYSGSYTFTDTLYAGTQYALEDLTVSGYIGGADFAEFFMELGGWGSYQDSGLVPSVGALVPVTGYENFYIVYVGFTYNYYGYTYTTYTYYTIGLGVVDTTVVAELAEQGTTELIDENVYGDDVLEAALDVTAYGSEYSYKHDISEDSYYGYYYDEVVINDKYVDLKEYDGGNTGSYTLTSQSGVIVSDSDSDIYTDTLYPYTVDGVVSVDTDNTTDFANADLTWNVLGIYDGLYGSEDQLLWTLFESSEVSGVVTNEYRFYGNGTAYYLGLYAYGNGTANSSVAAYCSYTIYTSLEVTGSYVGGNFVVSETSITPYMAYVLDSSGSYIYEWAFYFTNLVWDVNPNVTEDSTLETYLVSQTSSTPETPEESLVDEQSSLALSEGIQLKDAKTLF